MSQRHPVTPDGRYFVVRGRLWRTSDPTLEASTRVALVGELMAARRLGDPVAETHARASVDRAKRALGERGPVWWTDGAADFNRTMVDASPYASWDEGLRETLDADATD